MESPIQPCKNAYHTHTMMMMVGQLHLAMRTGETTLYWGSCIVVEGASSVQVLRAYSIAKSNEHSNCNKSPATPPSWKPCPHVVVVPVVPVMHFQASSNCPSPLPSTATKRVLHLANFREKSSDKTLPNSCRCSYRMAHIPLCAQYNVYIYIYMGARCTFLVPPPPPPWYGPPQY